MHFKSATRHFGPHRNSAPKVHWNVQTSQSKCQLNGLFGFSSWLLGLPQESLRLFVTAGYFYFASVSAETLRKYPLKQAWNYLASLFLPRRVIFALQSYFCLARQKVKNNPKRCLGCVSGWSEMRCFRLWKCTFGVVLLPDNRDHPMTTTTDIITKLSLPEDSPVTGEIQKGTAKNLS